MTKELKNSIKKINRCKNEIIRVGEILYSKGLVAGTDGNISIRTGPETMLTTCSGVHKGMMEPDQIIETTFARILEKNDPQSRDEGCPPSTEAAMHALIYRRSPEIRAVIHAHCPWSTALSLASGDDAEGIDLSGLEEGRLLFGKVPMAPVLPPGSMTLAESVALHFPKSRAVIMKAHGAVTAGRDLSEAFNLMEALEHNCRILGIAAMLSRNRA